MPYAFAPPKTGDAYADGSRLDAATRGTSEEDRREEANSKTIGNRASCSECGDGSGALVMDHDGRWLCGKCELKYVAADMRSDSARDARCEADEDICGLCGKPGADKMAHPEHWPGEQIPDGPLVHAECEQEECRRAHSLLTDEQRRNVLGGISKRTGNF